MSTDEKCATCGEAEFTKGHVLTEGSHPFQPAHTPAEPDYYIPHKALFMNERTPSAPESFGPNPQKRADRLSALLGEARPVLGKHQDGWGQDGPYVTEGYANFLARIDAEINNNEGGKK